jgi:hypothetical protein
MPTEIKQRYLEVREVGTNAVITVVEVLSPKNKRQGQGCSFYVDRHKKPFRPSHAYGLEQKGLARHWLLETPGNI